MTCLHTLGSYKDLRELVDKKSLNFIIGCYEDGIGDVCDISVSHGDEIHFGSYTMHTIGEALKCNHIDHYADFVRELINKKHNFPIVTFGKNSFIRLRTRDVRTGNDIANGFINYREIKSVKYKTVFENSIKVKRAVLQFKDGTMLEVYNTRRTIKEKIKDVIEIETALTHKFSSFEKTRDEYVFVL